MLKTKRIANVSKFLLQRIEKYTFEMKDLFKTKMTKEKQMKKFRKQKKCCV